MPQYVVFDDDWFNMDKVVRVRVNRDKGGEVTDVVLHFEGGDKHKVRDQAAKDIVAYLEKSKP